MQRDVPPYRADHVGSLLRSIALKQARSKLAAGQLSAADLKTVEDTEIKAIVAGFKRGSRWMTLRFRIQPPF